MERYHDDPEKTLQAQVRESHVWRVEHAARGAAWLWSLASVFMVAMISSSKDVPGLIPWRIWVDWLLAGVLGLFLHRKRRPQSCNERLLGGALGVGAVMLPILGLAESRMEVSALMLGASLVFVQGSVLGSDLQQALIYQGLEEEEARRMVRRVPAVWTVTGLLLLMLSMRMVLRGGFSLAYALFSLAASVTVTYFAVLDPLDARVLQKLAFCAELKERGTDDKAVRKWLDARLVGRYRRPWAILFVVQFLRLFYPHKVIHEDRIRLDEHDPIVFLANHGTIYGPVVAKLNIPTFVCPWVISYVMTDLDETTEYLYKYTFSRQHWLLPALRRPVARFVSRVSLWGMKALEGVPVYRDHPGQLMKTFRAAVEVSNRGDDMLIFPEDPNAIAADHGYEKNGVGPLFSGFAMLAPILYSRTGRRCRFVPLFAHQDSHTVAFGEEVVYDPERDPVEERERLVREIGASMNGLAQELEAAYQAKKRH